MNKKEVVRLNDFVIPSNYKILIEPAKDFNSYTGSVQIKANLTKPTKKIILHSKNLELSAATICVENQCLLPKLKENKELETISLENQKSIKGEIEIHIEFRGKLTNDLSGIYKSKYEYKGKEEYILTTQCEASYARKIFPCFDEPDKKAVFNLKIKIDKKFHAISNTPILNEKIENNKKVIEFKSTPKMSTYLFYLGIGDFEFSESDYKNVKLRLVTTKGKSKVSSFALDYTKKYLKYFEEFSGIPYPLEKLDLIAVPDFGAGAMENWGAITFRELLLLIDENKTSVSIKKRAAEVIAHELWHQWSGNLVTMKWWNDLWLNESFANYMAYKAVDHYNPEWKIWMDYLSGELASGLFKDSLKSTHPIEVKVNSPEEIEEIFDEISYSKGGSVLRMLENYMGEEKFRKGVSNYLKENAYSNAEAIDLWKSLDKIDKSKRVKDLIKYWISQPGYPLIRVEKEKDELKINQERINKKTNQIWPIPISIYDGYEEHKLLLQKKVEKIKINKKYVKFNHNQFGFYRTKYSKDLLQNLSNLVKENKLNDEDKWGIHNDLWALCNLSQESVENYLDFIKNYLNEKEYTILAEIAGSIRKLDRLYYYETWWPKTKDKLIKLLLPTYKNNLNVLGWDKKDSDSTEDILLRTLCISFCGFAKDPETINEAKKRYERNNLDLDTAGSVYSILAQNGDNILFEDLINKYEKTDNVEEKLKLLSALYLFRNDSILNRALDYAMTDKVRAQNLRNVFGTVLVNPASQKAIINWSKTNWDKLKKHQETHYIFEDFLEALIISQVEKSKKIEIESFLNKNGVKYEMSKTNSFEIMDMNLKFIEKNKEFLKNY
ncbi:MAG: M1 family metallopeptidase [Candidatus Pacearchaeota archaeon]